MINQPNIERAKEKEKYCKDIWNQIVLPKRVLNIWMAFSDSNIYLQHSGGDKLFERVSYYSAFM